MKKILILFFWTAVVTIPVKAQIKKTIGTNPNISNVSKSRLDSFTLPQRTDLRKQVGKDLSIALVSIDKNTSNFAIGVAGIYTVNFDIINSGAEDIDITGVVIQSYLYNANGTGSYISPEGGYGLIRGAPNFPANPILHPGERLRTSYVHRGFDPSVNNGNKFVIKIDNSNLIAETNETNNTLDIPVARNLESWSTPLPDLTFQVNSITPVTGSSFLNTSIDISLVNIGAGEIPLDIVNKILPMAQVYPAGSPGTNLYNEVYPLATRVVGGQTYPGYYKANAALKPGDKIRLGGSVHINGLASGSTIIFHMTFSTSDGSVIPETNTANNVVDFLYTVK